MGLKLRDRRAIELIDLVWCNLRGEVSTKRLMNRDGIDIVTRAVLSLGYRIDRSKSKAQSVEQVVVELEVKREF